MILSMWLQWSEVKHGRNLLITSQWCEPLTSEREITIDLNDFQGTLVQSTERQSMSWCRTPSRFHRSKVNDVNLCREWENLSLSHTYLKVLNLFLILFLRWWVDVNGNSLIEWGPWWIPPRWHETQSKVLEWCEYSNHKTDSKVLT